MNFTVSSNEGAKNAPNQKPGAGQPAKQPAKQRRSARDLRQELIDAGLAVLAEEGLDKLTLRRCAARVGVSHAAPAHHFNGLPHLLGCICAAGFEALLAAMRARKAQAATDPRAQLIAGCEAYVAFVADNPGLMQLMFNAPPGTVVAEELTPVSAAAYLELKADCAPFKPVGAQPDSTETLVWSLVHGLAFLRLGGRFDNPGRVTAQPRFADLLPELELR